MQHRPLELMLTFLFVAIFCTEPFRIPYAGRVDVCCFDKTGTITTEHLVLEGVAGVDAADGKKLLDVKQAGPRTTLCLSAAHALVKLDDGTVVGDPMEKTTLEALNWQIGKGDTIVPAEVKAAPVANVRIRRRFQFSSALKRMATVATTPDGRSFAAVKGAPETIKQMLAQVPEGYDEAYKWFTRRGSRVLALGIKDMGSLSTEAVSTMMWWWRWTLTLRDRSIRFLVSKSKASSCLLASLCSTARSNRMRSRV
jgi:manganese-transporting P-type ATPase